MKVGARLTATLISSLRRLLFHGHLSILPPLRQNQCIDSCSHACSRVPPVKGTPLLPSSRERKGGRMGCGERVWAASPSPASRQTSTGLGRAEGPTLGSSLPKEPPAPRPCPAAWHLVWVCRVGLLAPGYEPVNPSCVWTLPPSVGPELSFSSFRGRGGTSFIFSSLYLPPLPPDFLF